MNVTFIYPDVIGSAGYGGVFYVGIGLLSSVLKAAGHGTALLHITQPISQNEFQRRLAARPAEVFAFSCTTPMFYFVKIWARWTKECFPHVPVIVGGVHAILNPEEVLTEDAIDAVCTGEGEYALREFVAALAAGKTTAGIANIWTKQDGRIVSSARRPLIQDLDALPFPDRSLFDYPRLTEGRDRMLFVMASRGCPYDCPYCCNKSLRQAMSEDSPWVRFRGVTSVIQEIMQARALYPGTKFIGFWDDILALLPDWFAAFTRHYRSDVGLPFRCNMRANYVAREGLVRMLREAGCRRVIIGVESGNDYLRNTVLKRNMPEAELVQAGRWCKKYGIELATFNMVALPGETVRMALDTVKLNARLDADVTYMSVFYPFPKTQLHALCEQEGLITERVITDYVAGSALAFDRLTLAQFVFIRNFFRPLKNLYALFLRLPPRLSAALVAGCDALLSAKITALLLCLPVNAGFRAVRDNRILATLIRRLREAGTRDRIS